MPTLTCLRALLGKVLLGKASNLCCTTLVVRTRADTSVHSPPSGLPCDKEWMGIAPHEVHDLICVYTRHCFW